MDLKDLEIYKLAREVSRGAWEDFEKFDWETKKTVGFQWIRAIDSIAANIAEGFGRFHYLDKNKFNYNARGSLLESVHWTDLLVERNKLTKEKGESLTKKLNVLGVKLNNYIASTHKQTKKTT
jgi:four helix bundle protein